MPTTYGENAEITGSLAVDGNIDLGSGDDDVNLDSNTLFVDADQDKVGIGTTSPDYTLHVAGDIGVDQYIRHNGDTNTHINFTDDKINFKAGNLSMLTMEEKSSAPHEVRINQGGNNIDFVVEDNSGDTILMTDASTSRAGIGTNSPSHALDIEGELRVAQKYIYGYEEVTAGTSQTIALDKPITFVNNTAGNLTGSVADGSIIGETKWIITNGYHPSYDLKITFASCSWGQGSAGYVTLTGGVLQVVWASVGVRSMWYPMTFASGSMVAGS